MHCVLAIGLSLAENHDGLPCREGAFHALCELGWGRGEGGELELEMRKLQRHLQAGGELSFQLFGCVFF